jgi:peptidoglycan hydrolase CwlO-like protein
MSKELSEMKNLQGHSHNSALMKSMSAIGMPQELAHDFMDDSSEVRERIPEATPSDEPKGYPPPSRMEETLQRELSERQQDFDRLHSEKVEVEQTVEDLKNKLIQLNKEKQELYNEIDRITMEKSELENDMELVQYQV